MYKAIQEIKLDMEQQVVHSKNVIKQWFDQVNLFCIEILFYQSSFKSNGKLVFNQLFILGNWV